MLSQEAWVKGTRDKYSIPYKICTSLISVWFIDIISPFFYSRDSITHILQGYSLARWQLNECHRANDDSGSNWPIPTHNKTQQRAKGGYFLGCTCIVLHIYHVAIYQIWYFDKCIFVKHNSEVHMIHDTRVLACSCYKNCWSDTLIKFSIIMMAIRLATTATTTTTTTMMTTTTTTEELICDTMTLMGHHCNVLSMVAMGIQ